MTRAFSPAIAAVLALLCAGPALAQTPEFTHSVPLRDSTAKVTVTFHTERGGMVTCTPEQTEKIGAHAVERLTTLLPVLNARLLSRHDAPGTTIEVLLDAACYEGDIIGMGGYGRGEEKISMPYEESAQGGEWGPPVNEPTPTP